MFEIWEMQLKRSRSNRAPRRVFRRSKCLVGHVVTAVIFEKGMDLNITKIRAAGTCGSRCLGFKASSVCVCQGCILVLKI